MKELLLDQIKEIARKIADGDLNDLSKTKEELQILKDKIVVYEYLSNKMEELFEDKKEATTEIESKEEEAEIPVINDEVDSSQNQEDNLLEFEDLEEETEADINEEEEIDLEEIKKLEDKIEQAHLFEESEKKSLNDKFRKGSFSIGLNDRILFVKKLFDNSSQDYNRVISQISTYESFEEVEGFLNEFVKPDYNWNDSPEVADKFIEILQMKFN